MSDNSVYANILSKFVENPGKWKRHFTSQSVHPFDTVKWVRADARIMNSTGKVVFEQLSVEVPDFWDQNTINIVAEKYFRWIGNGSSKYKESSAKEMFSRVVAALKHWATEQNYFDSSEDANVYEDELLYCLVHQYGAFNSPVWFNLGVPGRKQAASACFISGIEDSLDDIMDYQKSEIAIFRGGSGSGANLSNLRSSWEKISAGSYTSGPMSWMNGLDSYAGAMKSGGATRNAAKMNVLDIDHPDILQTRDGRPGFITCKAVEEKLAHDLVKIGYSVNYDDPNGAYKRVKFQNANNSVSISDEFMNAVLNDGEWCTTSRVNGEPINTYKAKDLWKEIANAAWICGDPGIQFTTVINKWHTTPNAGRIRASNPCSEFLHVDDTACNLCAINLTKYFNSENKLNIFDYCNAIRVFSVSQMAIVGKAEYPTEAIKINSHKLRPIGTNYGDLGSLLMRMGHSYDSDIGRQYAAALASMMTGIVYLCSSGIALKTFPFPEFENNKEEMLDVMKMHRDHLVSGPTEEIYNFSKNLWEKVISYGETYGYNISQATLQAPLGTISFLMGMNTTGIEPAIGLVSYKSMVGGGYAKIVNKDVPIALKNLYYTDESIEEILKYIDVHGHVDGCEYLLNAHRPVFDCALPVGPNGRCLTPMAHLKMMAAIQPNITCAQSKTVNLPNSSTVEEIANIYMSAWMMGIKCVALYRDGCKASQPLSVTKTEDVKEVKEPSKSFDKKILKSTKATRQRLPDDITGWRHKFSIDGYKGYLIVNEYPDGRPGEVFLKLGKPGSTVSGLLDGFTQLLSIALQYGIPLNRFVPSFTNTKFDPAGMTNNPDIPFSSSLYDYIFKVLDLKYYGGEYSEIKNTVDKIRASKAPPDGESMSRDESDDNAFPEDLSDHDHNFKPSKSLDAPLCSNCSSVTFRNGSCYLCTNCGTTTGCS